MFQALALFIFAYIAIKNIGVLYKIAGGYLAIIFVLWILGMIFFLD